jgi:hypothetical protein
MRIYKLLDNDGRFFAFEIENAYIGRRTIEKLLNSIEEVSDVRRNKHLAYSDIRVRFKFRNEDFIVLEPFGDNSRYWIGPDSDDGYSGTDITSIENAFKNYQPPFLIKIFGDLISLV